MNEKLLASTEAFVGWIKNDSLPLWIENGINADNGASFERFLGDGSVDKTANTRVRVQARQMFVFSTAAHFDWLEKSKAEELVTGLAAFVEKYGRHKSGKGNIHLLSPSYSVINDMQDLYDHAFFLLSNAWRYRVFGDKDALANAKELVLFLDEKFGQSTGGWIEGDYEYECRRQNPHMHLFEAFLALYEASGEATWLARAGEMFALFETRFFDAEHDILREYFNNDWTPLDSQKGDIVEPGHMMEWVWLLRWYGSLAEKDVSRYADALYENGLKIGLSESGLLYDEVSPTGEVITDTKRCWPMTELIKASLAQAKAGREGCEERAAEAIDLLMKFYLSSPTKGSYIDRLDGSDKVIVDFAPASSMYHLIVAAFEAARYIK